MNYRNVEAKWRALGRKLLCENAPDEEIDDDLSFEQFLSGDEESTKIKERLVKRKLSRLKTIGAHDPGNGPWYPPVRVDKDSAPAGRSFCLGGIGCAELVADSERMVLALQSAGWARVEEFEMPDVFIVLSCAFSSEKKVESIKMARKIKVQYPGKKVFVVGCLPARYGEDLCRELPEIDGFLGNKNPLAVVQLVGGHATGPGNLSVRAHFDAPPGSVFAYPGSAFVKISEGCSNHCTYCAVPLIRGKFSSRPMDEIVSEIKGLQKNGIRQFRLIAQDTCSYGKDIGSSLTNLLSDIASLDGEFWVQLIYLHPDHFPPELIDLMTGNPRFPPYFDIPFQHAAPGILRAMGRKSDPLRNLELISDIRSRVPNAVFNSHFIVGFPGESDSDFKYLLDFQEKARPEWSTAIRYSREEETPAYRLPGQVSDKIAHERQTEMDRRQLFVTNRFLETLVGKIIKVLIVKQAAGGSLGVSYLQCTDWGAGVVVSSQLAPGTMADVLIIRRNGLKLEGETVTKD